MKKNIAIFILSVLTMLSLIFAFAQKTIAKKNAVEAMNQTALAEEQSRIAHMNADKARIAQQEADMAQHRAIVAMEEAAEALRKCK